MSLWPQYCHQSAGRGNFQALDAKFVAGGGWGSGGCSQNFRSRQEPGVGTILKASALPANTSCQGAAQIPIPSKQGCFLENGMQKASVSTPHHWQTISLQKPMLESQAMKNETLSPHLGPGNLLPHCYPIFSIHSVMGNSLSSFLPQGLSIPISSSLNHIPLGLAQMSPPLTTPRAHVTGSSCLATLVVCLFEGQEAGLLWCQQYSTLEYGCPKIVSCSYNSQNYRNSPQV